MDYVIVIVGAGVFLAVGLYCIKKADSFFESGMGYPEKRLEREENSIRIALENPLMINSIEKVTERFSRSHKNLAVYVFSGSAGAIKESIDTGDIDIGVLTQESASGIEMEYDELLIPSHPGKMIASDTGVTIRPLGNCASVIVVVWNSAALTILQNAYIKSFHGVHKGGI